VKHGLAENNTLEENRIGLSIGHRDTDNLITGNIIRLSKDNGLLFSRSRDRTLPATVIASKATKFIDNAPAGGTVIDIQGGTESITLLGNEFVEKPVMASHESQSSRVRKRKTSS